MPEDFSLEFNRKKPDADALDAPDALDTLKQGNEELRRELEELKAQFANQTPRMSTDDDPAIEPWKGYED